MQYKHMIVNGELKDFPPENKVSYNKYGLPVYIDDYGMGSSHWSLILSPDDQEIRQRIDNIIWAVERLKWATETCPRERPELLAVIASGGIRK